MMNLFRRRRNAPPPPEVMTETAPDPVQEEVAPSSYEPWTPEEATPVPPAGSHTPAAEPSAPEASATPVEPAVEEPAVEEPAVEEHEADSTEARVADALKKVYDPEIPVSIYDLGLIYAIDVGEEGRIGVTMTLTTPGCPVAEQMPDMVGHAVLEFVPEARDVDVEIVWDPPWRPDMMSDAAKLELGFY